MRGYGLSTSLIADVEGGMRACVTDSEKLLYSVEYILVGTTLEYLEAGILLCVIALKRSRARTSL